MAKVTICDVNIAIAPHCIDFPLLPQLSPLLRGKALEPAMAERNAVINHSVQLTQPAAGIETLGQQC